MVTTAIFRLTSEGSSSTRSDYAPPAIQEGSATVVHENATSSGESGAQPARVGALPNDSQRETADIARTESAGAREDSFNQTNAATGGPATPPSNVADEIGAPDSESDLTAIEGSEIYIPEEIAPLLDQPGIRDLHENLEREAPERSWAPYMEGLLRSYFDARMEILQSFSYPFIECRASMCEIQAIGYGPSAGAEWARATADLPSQPWFEFTSAYAPMRDDGGVLGVLLILRRESQTLQSSDGPSKTS